ncbi:hypothetical protein AUEXF2481DRAFT_2374 [Aureobasidium subglaciale EXF-2481]|uniref:Protein kinase domain-containing protein n=1 Tax=Aureobasidium subglaciale (strain EXF-2481) TaxID=1043005 RepID=A0A074YL58_AURSE|nr:uncharacterized protein AUEXF2481DRAFT_2374 [Aureobasidium subglaciale EXF-2481]KEQ98425.1 hypothetical protein AUEXF2481DRAFT_2374 [Aureobasidium subglaciale EXF-2481]
MPYASRISVGTTFASFNDPNLKYRIEKRVGSGGFSEIFQEEATKLMQLKGHPHIMELEDVMQMPQNAEAGLIMELASEGHLRGLLDRLPKQHHVSLSQRVTYEMVEALYHIHSHNPPIVHRDIKPDNILVFLAGTEHSPHYLFKLADFGLADTALSLIRSMLEKIPCRRPSAEQCKRYIWYREGAAAVVYKMTNTITNMYAGYDSLDSMSEMTIDSDSSLEDDCPADSMKHEHGMKCLVSLKHNHRLDRRRSS